MYPIKVGNIVLIPIPGQEGVFNVGEHFLIVVNVNLAHGYVEAVYTTSLKNGDNGGRYRLLPEERAAAGFRKECRFDPGSRFRYTPEELLALGRVTGHLSKRFHQRVLDAVIATKARPVVFNSSLPLKGQFVW